MPSSDSTRQVKRPYAGTQSHNQSTITAYFCPTPAQGLISSNSSTIRPSETSSPLSPPLPLSVQSNLLSVGMRIRKSVPEGYKTGTNYGGFTLFSNNDPAVPQTIPQPRIYGGASRKELTPFCGILKVGGMAVQQGYGGGGSRWGEEEEELGEDNISSLGSHGSTMSNISVAHVAGSRNKRPLDEDEEGEGKLDVKVVDCLQNGRIWQDQDVQLSPKSKPVDWRGWSLGTRIMAVPKSRRKGSSLGVAKKGAVIDEQENVMDFEEADFLDYRLWDEEEVVMRDI